MLDRVIKELEDLMSNNIERKGGDQVKVLALNGSPRGQKGNTEQVLQSFLEGMEDQGAVIEKIYLKEKEIRHCLGCFSCWKKTPGKCIQFDDMSDLLPRYIEADILVYATPLYCFTVTGIMKNFMDRCLPSVNPASDKQNGYQCNNSIKKTVLISTAGFSGRHNFSGLVETFKAMCGGSLNGTILCTQGELLQIKSLQTILAPFFNTVRIAGREIINYGFITPEVQADIDKDYIDPKAYLQIANKHWHSSGK